MTVPQTGDFNKHTLDKKAKICYNTGNAGVADNRYRSRIACPHPCPPAGPGGTRFLSPLLFDNSIPQSSVTRVSLVMQTRGLSSTATPVGNVRKGYRLSARHKSGARSGTVPSRCTTRQRYKSETTRQNLVTLVTPKYPVGHGRRAVPVDACRSATKPSERRPMLHRLKK